MIPVNRLVALLTPVFSAAAAVGSAWLLKHFPGLPVPSTVELTAVEVLGATTAGGAALKWLHGHQAFEKRLDEAERDAKLLAAHVTAAAPALAKAPGAVFDRVVSDAEEFAHQPPAAEPVGA
jgi:hypothetical protein